MEAGDRTPDFALPVDGGGTLRLADFAGRKLVLFFYPKADTTACTREAQEFGDRAEAFAAAGAVVVGVSRDPVRKLERFKAKYGLRVALASDEAGALTEAMGIWVQKTLYGRHYMGIERTTLLVDGGGVIRQRWSKVRVAGHAEAVLQAARGV